MGTSLKKIAIIGSAGVGKTTLLNTLFENDLIKSHYTKIDEVVRTLCAERGYKTPYEIEGDMHKFREEILAKQIELENSADSFIIDRSTVDAWAYYMRWSWNQAKVEETESFYQSAFKQARKYDLFIYLPISFDLIDDGFRWANKTYQEQIDRLILSIVRDWDLSEKLYKVEGLTIEEKIIELYGLLRRSAPRNDG